MQWRCGIRMVIHSAVAWKRTSLTERLPLQEIVGTPDCVLLATFGNINHRLPIKDQAVAALRVVYEMAPAQHRIIKLTHAAQPLDLPHLSHSG